MTAEPREGIDRERPGGADRGAGRPLLCITPSPAIDRTARVPLITSGEVLRPTQVVVLPGGKGVNAARAAAHLGARVITTGIAGGHAGRWIVEALEREGLSPRFALAEAESRTAYVTVDEAGASTIVYERPSPVTADEFEAFLELLERELLPRAARAIIAGTLPAGVALEDYARIVAAARNAGCPLLVDTSGDWLRAALAGEPDIVKVGRVEVVEAGLVDAAATTTESAMALVRAGARLAVVTDGGAPAAASDGARTWLVEVPQVRTLNAVGSGDAVNAGLSVALERGASMEEALACAMAAGTANALSIGAGMLDPQVARDLERQTLVSVVPSPEGATRWIA